MKKRYFKARPKSLSKGYDSKLELRLHQTALADCSHHCDKDDRVNYSVPHKYEYDFLVEVGDKLYVIEAKGRFQDSATAAKYLHIRNYLESWLPTISTCKEVELVFIFENAKTPYPFAKKRKDGTKQDHGEWATKNKFRWLCEKRGDLEGVVTKFDLIKRLEELNS